MLFSNTVLSRVTVKGRLLIIIFQKIGIYLGMPSSKIYLDFPAQSKDRTKNSYFA